MKVEVVNAGKTTPGRSSAISIRGRGQIQGQDIAGNANVVTAMVRFKTCSLCHNLRSMSQGRATSLMQFDHYASAGARSRGNPGEVRLTPDEKPFEFQDQRRPPWARKSSSRQAALQRRHVNSECPSGRTGKTIRFRNRGSLELDNELRQDVNRAADCFHRACTRSEMAGWKKARGTRSSTAPCRSGHSGERRAAGLGQNLGNRAAVSDVLRDRRGRSWPTLQCGLSR